MKNLKEILQTAKNQVTAQHLINGKIYTSEGWTNFDLEDKTELFSLISDALGGHQKTKDSIKWNLYKNPQHWGLSRIFLSLRDNKIYCSYCAGQDYQAETQLIRNYIKNYY